MSLSSSLPLILNPKLRWEENNETVTKVGKTVKTAEKTKKKKEKARANANAEMEKSLPGLHSSQKER